VPVLNKMVHHHVTREVIVHRDVWLGLKCLPSLVALFLFLSHDESLDVVEETVKITWSLLSEWCRHWMWIVTFDVTSGMLPCHIKKHDSLPSLTNVGLVAHMMDNLATKSHFLPSCLIQT